jgi:hypothetical protein
VARSGGVLVAMMMMLMLLAGVTSAATVMRFDTNDLVDRANVILHGKITSKECRKTASGSVVTDLRVDVYEAIKGVKGKTFSFTVYGGVVGTRGSAISGAPTFDEGEEILVFLDAETRQGLRMTVGLGQGKYTIRVVDGKKLAFREMEGLQLMDRKSGEVKEAKSEQGRPLSELLGEVRARLRATAGKKGNK